MRRVEKNRFLPRNLRRLLPGVLAAFLVSITGYTQAVSADSHGGGLFSNIFKQPGTDTRVTSQGGPSINEARREAYNGPKARIAVARFTDKTRKGWWNRGIGDGMADQLTTALFQTNRYIVLERETLNDVMREQDLVTAGRVSQQTGAPTGQIEGAELLITGAVTEFEGNSGGGGGSIGGGLFGDAGKIVGRLARSYRTAHMAIDLRVIDARTSRILAATSVEGEASDVNIGAALLGRTGGAALGGALSGWKNTPIEKALRQCIQDAVNFVVSQTPQQFYRHGQGNYAAARSVPAAAAPRTQRAQPPAPQRSSRQVPDYQAGQVARVSSSRLNVRSGPGTGNPVVFTLRQGNGMLVLGRQGDWIQVKDEQQRVGWTAGWLTYRDANADPSAFEQQVATQAPAPASAVSAPTQSAPAPAQPAAAAGGQDVASRLKRIDGLRDQGIISDEEHATLRQKILSEL